MMMMPLPNDRLRMRVTNLTRSLKKTSLHAFNNERVVGRKLMKSGMGYMPTQGVLLTPYY
jgi:hypothetical protein